MWRRFALAALAIALQSAGPGVTAHAEDKFPCEAFVRLGDGTWQAIETALIPGPNFKAREGSLWRPGATVMGIDMAKTLDQECPNVPLAQPEGGAAPGAPGAPGQAQQPQIPRVPQVPLSKYADANGNIDIQRLTCGHVADASTEEADLLLAWYSGWYQGLAKGRGINLARVRYALRNVEDYCKANRDKKLTQVMELMLK